MGENSRIEWCDHTFNPWVGCQKVSPACDHCYAEGWAKRSGMVQWGPHAERRRTSVANWQKPFKWAAKARATGERPRVFCASLADVFDNRVPPEWRADLFELIAQTPELDWLLLTKRPENVGKMLPNTWGAGWANVMLGVTVESGKYLGRAWTLFGVAGDDARCFISYEPALGPLGRIEDVWRPGDRPRLLQVICGGESGPGARPMHPDWARDARDQCGAAVVPFFFKQWGEWAPIDPGRWEDDTFIPDMAPGDIWMRRDGLIGNGKGDLSSPPRVWAPAEMAIMRRVGKKRAGALLDGREHRAFPL